MGKGDKKTKRGKIILGSFGTRRPRRPKALAPVSIVTKKVEKPKPEKPKLVKHPEAISELIAEPIAVIVDSPDKPSGDEKISAKPKAPKKAPAKPAKPKDTSVE